MGKPTYSTSNGERYTTDQIEWRVKLSKSEKKMDSDNCCERCESNQGRLTMSHIVSVKYAKEWGLAQLCWDVNNLELLCEGCHNEIESRTAEERLEHFHSK